VEFAERYLPERNIVEGDSKVGSSVTLAAQNDKSILIVILNEVKDLCFVNPVHPTDPVILSVMVFSVCLFSIKKLDVRLLPHFGDHFLMCAQGFFPQQ
jgi:hypothetical protein